MVGFPKFLAQDSVAGIAFFDFGADEFFGGAVGGGDGGVVGFVVGAHAGVEVAEGDSPGAVGGFSGEVEQGLQVHSSSFIKIRGTRAEILVITS